jgi:hypothetical protein
MARANFALSEKRRAVMSKPTHSYFPFQTPNSSGCPGHPIVFPPPPNKHQQPLAEGAKNIGIWRAKTKCDKGKNA